MPTGKYYEAVGRRKVATARVRLFEATGDFIVNDKVVGKYFDSISDAALRYNNPFELTGTKGKFSVLVKVSGSGKSAQLDAMVHGISRALVKFDPAYKTLLKTEGLMSRDDRMKETRKIGMGGKARRKRQSPKR
ncbi:MAG: 30S ribosomal protein S9 [Pseudomonadales bacterium]|nr:30S ribosomal protein S9 [Pseudomonadales bacterium]